MSTLKTVAYYSFSQVSEKVLILQYIFIYIWWMWGSSIWYVILGIVQSALYILTFFEGILLVVTPLLPGSGRSAGGGIGHPLQYSWASLVAQLVKNPSAVRETWIWSLGWEDPLEKGKATHSSSGLENFMDCSLPTSSFPWGFSRQENWSGLPCPPPGDLPNPGIKSRSPALLADSLPSEPPGKWQVAGWSP